MIQCVKERISISGFSFLEFLKMLVCLCNLRLALIEAGHWDVVGMWFGLTLVDLFYRGTNQSIKETV